MLVHGMALFAMSMVQSTDLAPVSALDAIVPRVEVESVVAESKDVSVKPSRSLNARRRALARGRNQFRQNRFLQGRTRIGGGGGLFGNRIRLIPQMPRLSIPRLSLPSIAMPRISMPAIAMPDISLPSRETLMTPITAYNNLSPVSKALLKTAVPPLNVIDLVSAARSQMNAVQTLGNSGATLNAAGVTQTLLR